MKNDLCRFKGKCNYRVTFNTLNTSFNIMNLQIVINFKLSFFLVILYLKNLINCLWRPNSKKKQLNFFTFKKDPTKTFSMLSSSFKVNTF